MSQKFSVIIPCYNSGHYILEALKSLEGFGRDVEFETIIINDGSTDPETLRILSDLEAGDSIVVHQKNMGASAARNAGVKIASAEYLLLLDSDNKIHAPVVLEAISLLDNNPQVGIVYGDVNFFGETSKRKFKNAAFDPLTFLVENNVDMCSLVRRSIWVELGGLDENLAAIEDWELWIRIYKAGWKFIYLDKVFFDYRVRVGSLMDQNMEFSKLQALKKYIYMKHFDIMIDNHFKLRHHYITYQEDIKRPFRSFFKYFYLTYLKRLKF